MLISEIKLNPAYSLLLQNEPGTKFDLLVENIRQDGLRDAIILNRLNELIDGHTRLKALKVLGETTVPDDKIIVKHFSSIQDAQLFMLHNQLGRRNLSANERKDLVPKLQNLFKLKYGQGRIEKGENNPFSVTTNKLIAQALGVSEDTIKRDKRAIKKVNNALDEAGIDYSQMSFYDKKELAKQIEAEQEQELECIGESTPTDRLKDKITSLHKEANELEAKGSNFDTPLESAAIKPEQKALSHMNKISKGIQDLKRLKLDSNIKANMLTDLLINELLSISDKESAIDIILSKLETI